MNGDIIDTKSVDAVDRVIFVVVDCLRYDAYRSQMETLRTLGDQYISVTDHHSLGPMTPASMPGLMQSRQPIEHGGAGMHLREDIPTLAEALSNAGVHTVGWHSNSYVSADYGFDRGFDNYHDLDGGDAEEDKQVDGRAKMRSLVGRKVAEMIITPLKRRGIVDWTMQSDAEEFFERSLSELQDTEREFHYLHLMDPHYPYAPPDTSGVGRRAEYDANKMLQEGPEAIGPEEVDTLKSAYRAEAKYVDEQIGEYVTELQSRGLWESTALVVTADHGELFHDRVVPEGTTALTHPNYCCEELLHVPLVIAGGGIPTETYDSVTSAENLAPTICDLFGVQIPSAWERDCGPEQDVAISSTMHKRQDGVELSEGCLHVAARSVDHAVLWWADSTAAECYSRDGSEYQVAKGGSAFHDLEIICEEVSTWMDPVTGETDIGGVVTDRLRRLGYVEE